MPPSPLFGNAPTSLALREIIRRLESVYCYHIGAEFSHIQDVDEVAWWKTSLETPFVGYDPQTRMRIFQGLVQGAGFENFLQKKFKSEKRFGVDGCEVLVPGVKLGRESRSMRMKRETTFAHLFYFFFSFAHLFINVHILSLSLSLYLSFYLSIYLSSHLYIHKFPFPLL